MSAIYIVAFCAGVLCKTYDDIVDNNIEFVTPVAKESLKMAHTLLYGILASFDAPFAFIFYVVNLINAFLNPSAWTGDYERACLYILWVPCLVSILYHMHTNITPKVNGADFSLLVLMMCAGICEVFIRFSNRRHAGAIGIDFVRPCDEPGCEEPDNDNDNGEEPENQEINPKKLLLRATSATILLAIFMMCPWFSPFVNKIIIYTVGYLTTSSAFQMWGLRLRYACPGTLDGNQ
jgi:hypothetical protein